MNMACSRWIATLLALNVALSSCATGVLKESSCRVVTAKGSVDLSRLKEANNNQLFSALNWSNTSLYVWSPCDNADVLGSAYNVNNSSKEGCRAFALMEYELGIQTCTFIADQSSAKFSFDEDNRQLKLSYEGGLYTVGIILTCHKSRIPIFGFIGEEDDLFDLTFELKSEHCCSSSGYIPSYGTLACITFAVVSVLYFVIGAIYRRFKLKATYRRALPNAEFWMDLPHLVQDGALFVVCYYKPNHKYAKVKSTLAKGATDGSDDEYEVVVNPAARLIESEYMDETAADAESVAEPAENSKLIKRKPREREEDTRVDPVNV